jgi:ATP-dependent Clp protease protease subunit
MSVPVIIEKVGKAVHTFDIDTKLFQNRIIYFSGDVTPESAKEVITELLYLDSVDNSDISLYINSPGGSVTDGLAIVDTMKAISSKVNTVGLGMCASMGAVLLVSGTGIRKCTKNCQILLHTASSYNGVQNVHEAKIEYEQLQKLNDLCLNIISEKSNFSVEEIRNLTLHDCWISTDVALKNGIIDDIV